MKKLVLGLMFVFLIPFISGHAITVSEEQRLIQTLLEQITVLQKQIEVILKAKNITPPKTVQSLNVNTDTSPIGSANFLGSAVSIAQTPNFNGISTSTFFAELKINITAIKDVEIPKKNAFVFKIYKDGIPITSNNSISITYSVPNNGVTKDLSASNTFLIPANLSITLPISFIMEGRNMDGTLVPRGLYTLELTEIKPISGMIIMNALPWKTGGGSFPAGQNEPVSTKFKFGDIVKTAINLNIRQTPSNANTGNILGIQASNSFGTVIGGPISSGNFLWWWNIDYKTGVDGWSLETYLDKSGVLGDVNGDSYVNCADVSIISQFTINLVNLTTEEKYRADVNKDGVVNIIDAQQITKNNNLSCDTPKPTGGNGDTDGNGVVSCDDVNMITKYTIGTIALTVEQKLRADINNDGVVNIIDAQQIVKNNNLSCTTASAPIPTIYLVANPSTINSGQSSTITLSSTGASRCDSGDIAWESGKTAGSVVVSPTQSKVYGFICYNDQGLSSGKSISIAVVSPQSMLGDVNLDNFVNVIDAQQVSRHVSGATILTGQALINADVNKDGQVTSVDADLIVQYGIGLIKGF